MSLSRAQSEALALTRQLRSLFIYSPLRRLAGNTLSLLTSDVVNRATTFVLYALVARYLGAFEFGQMSLALTLFYTFQVIAAAGLRTVITREVARAHAETDRYLINGSLIAALFSLLSLIALWLFIRVMGYQADTQRVILLLALGLAPYALTTVCEGIFQARERMGLIALANVPMNLVKVVLSIILLHGGYSLQTLVLAFVLVCITVLILEWWLMLRFITRPRMVVDLSFGRSLIGASSTFLGIDILIAIWASLYIFLLSVQRDEVEVGLYSAASQLTVPILLIFQSMMQSLFPLLCQRFDSGVQSMKAIVDSLLELMLAMALPAAVGLFILAPSVLLLLYGNPDLLPAVTALRIFVWYIVFRAVTAAVGQVLWASRRERVTLRIVAINLLVSLAFGLPLIHFNGVNGAALAGLLAAAVNCAQHLYAVRQIMPLARLDQLLGKPIVAVLVMALYLWWAQAQALVFQILIGGVLYTSVYILLATWAGDGLWRMALRASRAS